MIDIAVLKPSEIEELASRPWSASEKVDVLTGISDLLRKTPSDGGADSDRIYMAASCLTQAGAWDVISPKELAQILLASNTGSRNDFLDGLPSEFSGSVSREVLRRLGEPNQAA